MNTNGMNADIVKALVKNYTDNHLAVINASAALTALRAPGSSSDAWSAFFSINDLKTFIDQVESNTYVKCNDVSGELGIRFYYAEYPAYDSPLWGTPGLPASLQQYAGMHTLLLVPTYRDDSSGNNVDFDPTCATPAGIPIPLPVVFSNLPGPNGSNVMMMDHAGLIPPPFLAPGAFGPATGAYLYDIAN